MTRIEEFEIAMDGALQKIGEQKSDRVSNHWKKRRG